MVINQANMDALFKTFSKRFSDAQQAAAARAFPNQLIAEDIALLLPVSGAATQHSWLDQIKGIHEWAGDRVINNLKLQALTVANRSFENTVSVPRTSIEDDQYGMFAPLIGALGADAETLWIKLAVASLLANGTWADGNPFFCSGRKLSDMKSAVALTNAVTTALSKTAAEAALTAIRSWTLGGNEPADVVPEYLVVGPSLEGMAKSIVEAEIEANAGGTLAVSNVSPARMLKVRVDSRIIGDHATKWFITARKAGIPCVCVQQRKKPVLTRLDRDTDANVFMQDKYLYGVDARGESFLTLPFFAYAGGFTAVAAWDKTKVP